MAETQVTGPVRVRFAPSPTGYLHVGGARTAIYNELLRQSLGGEFVLRIEDTDKARSDQSMIEQIEEGLRWVGISWDEGAFLQSAGVDDHRAAAQKLLEEGKAYRCFRSQEEVAEKRDAAQRAKEDARYKALFDEVPADEAQKRADAGEAHVIRFRMPDEDIVIDDLVRGKVTFKAKVLDDFVILRADGSPLYHLSVVCDDISMKISHVIRGEDHLSNTPKHIGLFRALGAEVPTFAHLPLIMGKDKKRLSKRTGAASAEEFRDQGYLPQAVYNYLALLGWSPGDDREVMNREEMIEAFTAERLRGSASIFDADKLAWMNAQYMSGLPYEELLPHAQSYLEKAGLADKDPQRLQEVLDVCRTRAKTLEELAEFAGSYFLDEIPYDAELCAKFLKDPDMPAKVEKLAESYGALEEFTVESTDAALRALAGELEVKAGVLIHPTRMALTGSKAGPSLFDVVAVTGQEMSVKHLRRFAEFLRSQA